MGVHDVRLRRPIQPYQLPDDFAVLDRMQLPHQVGNDHDGHAERSGRFNQAAFRTGLRSAGKKRHITLTVEQLDGVKRVPLRAADNHAGDEV